MPLSSHPQLAKLIAKASAVSSVTGFNSLPQKYKDVLSSEVMLWPELNPEDMPVPIGSRCCGQLCIAP